MTMASLLTFSAASAHSSTRAGQSLSLSAVWEPMLPPVVRPRWQTMMSAPAFAMAETTAPKEALGRTLADTGLRSRYDVTVVCTKQPGGTFSLTTPETVLDADDILLVIGEKENVERFSRLD